VIVASLDVAEPTGADAARRTLTARLAQARACHVAALRGDPTLAGEVTLVLVLSDDGKVARATATGLGDVGACLAARARSWEFAPGTGTVRARYRFAVSGP
jgi:hypothetical protein